MEEETPKGQKQVLRWMLTCPNMDKVAKSKMKKKRMAVLSEGAGGPKRREAALDEQKPFHLGRQGKNTKCSDRRRKRWIG